MNNRDKFAARLTLEYTDLFATDLNYACSAAKCTPAGLAMKMTLALADGTANKDGKAIKRACKHFGIPHNYKSIKSFFNQS